MTNIEGDRPRRPAEVDRSLFWWWFAIGGQIVSDIVQVILPGSASSLSHLFQPGQVAVSGVSVGGIVVQAITLLIWAVLVHNLRLGSNGARWVLTVFAAIEELVLLGLIVLWFTAPSVGSILLGIVGLAVFAAVLLAIIAMHRPAAAIHFQRLT
jgi:hypothetical protein